MYLCTIASLQGKVTPQWRDRQTVKFYGQKTNNALVIPPICDIYLHSI